MARAAALLTVFLLAVSTVCAAAGAYTIASKVTHAGGKTTFAYTVTRKTTQRPAHLTSFSIRVPDCLATGPFPAWGPKNVGGATPPAEFTKIGSYFFRWNFGFPPNALSTTYTVTFTGSISANTETFIGWSEDGTIGGHVDSGTICGPGSCPATTPTPSPSPIVVKTFTELKTAVETPPPAGCTRRVVNVADDITWPKCCVKNYCNGLPCPTCCPLNVTRSVLIKGCGAKKTLDGNGQGNIIVQTAGSLSLSNLILQHANTNTDQICNSFFGGAVFVSRGGLYATDVTFQDNVAYDGAGVYVGLYYASGGAKAVFNRCSFFRNHALASICEQVPGSIGGNGGGVNTASGGRSAYRYCTFGKGANKNTFQGGRIFDSYSGGGPDVAGGGTACPSITGIDTTNSTALTTPATCPARCPSGSCPVYKSC
eukprot:jgi/Chlat1/7195/Chrsp57S00535